VSVFVTGSDAGVGKTQFAVWLLRMLRSSGLRSAGMKPICCGDRHDAELLLAASSEGLTIDDVNPMWLRTPAAPFTAAMVEERSIDIELIVKKFLELDHRFECVVVEGVGGWLVPIRADYFVGNLAAALKLPVIVVAQNRLGCLNHTLPTIRSVEARGLMCIGLVLNNFGSTARRRLKNESRRFATGASRFRCWRISMTISAKFHICCGKCCQKSQLQADEAFTARVTVMYCKFTHDRDWANLFLR
jgi:dethiobiotin synthetase